MKCSKCGSGRILKNGVCQRCEHVQNKAPESATKPKPKFKSKLDVHPDYQTVVSKFKEWVDKVAEELLENATGTITIGYKVEAGQQFILGFKSERFDHTVLRAYIPAEGFPITLSFSGNESTIDSHKALLKFLYEDFAKDEDLMSTLRALYATCH